MSKRRTIYTPVSDHEWVQPIKRGYRMACCDCGLVHLMDFRVKDGRVQFRAVRDKRKTASFRREKAKRVAA